MKRKNNGLTPIDPEVTATFDELFPDSGDVDQFNYNGLEHNKLGRLATECCRLGLLFSAYYSSVKHTLVVSVRAGEKKRAYEYESAEAFNLNIDLLLKQLMGMVKSKPK